jgi:hypothetical protein
VVAGSSGLAVGAVAAFAFGATGRPGRLTSLLGREAFDSHSTAQPIP